MTNTPSVGTVYVFFRGAVGSSSGYVNLPSVPLPFRTSNTGYTLPFCTSSQIGCTSFMPPTGASFAATKSTSYVRNTVYGFGVRSWIM